MTITLPLAPVRKSDFRLITCPWLAEGLFHVNLPEMGTLMPQGSQCIIINLDSEFLGCAHIPGTKVMETVMQHPNEFNNPSNEL